MVQKLCDSSQLMQRDRNNCKSPKNNGRKKLILEPGVVHKFSQDQDVDWYNLEDTWITLRLTGNCHAHTPHLRNTQAMKKEVEVEERDHEHDICTKMRLK